jgi:hypothetical protein
MDLERGIDKLFSNDDHRPVWKGMSSRKPRRNLRAKLAGKRPELCPDLSRHYRTIGIKAIAASTHRGSRSTTAAERKHETENRAKQETDE